jgi:hypothetical protein
MGVLHSTYPMHQASSKWISQALSGVDAAIHAWHVDVLPTFLTSDNSHNSIYFDWRGTKLYNVI